MISVLTLTTASRAWCLPMAIAAFRRQTYQGDAEMLILSDGEPMPIVGADGERVRHEWLSGPRRLGAKRNAAIKRARGDVLAVLDDDDWVSPDWLATRAAALESGAQIAGTTGLLLHDLRECRTWRYGYQEARPYVVHGGCAFTRAAWEAAGGYPDRRRGEDTFFLWKACEWAGNRIAVSDDISHYVAMYHGQRCGRPHWQPRPPRYVRSDVGAAEIMGADLAGYEAAVARREADKLS